MNECIRSTLTPLPPDHSRPHYHNGRGRTAEGGVSVLETKEFGILHLMLKHLHNI